MYFERRIYYGKWAKVLAVEGFRVPKQTVWASVQKYKSHGAISHLPGSARPFKLTHEMLKAVEEKLNQDDETTMTQLVKVLEEHEWKISKSTIERAREALGWAFHSSCYMTVDLAGHERKEGSVGKRKYAQFLRRRTLNR